MPGRLFRYFKMFQLPHSSLCLRLQRGSRSMSGVQETDNGRPTICFRNLNFEGEDRDEYLMIRVESFRVYSIIPFALLCVCANSSTWGSSMKALKCREIVLAVLDQLRDSKTSETVQTMQVSLAM